MAAVKAFERAGFVIIRQSGHIVMAKGELRIVLPRGTPIKAHTMGGIIKDAGLTNDQFRDLL